MDRLRRNIQHGQKRRMPWSRRLPIGILAVELGVFIVAVIIWAPAFVAYINR